MLAPLSEGRQSAVYHKMLHDRDPKIGSPIRNAVSERKFLAKAMAPETQMTHLDTVKPVISQDRLPLCFCLCCRCSLYDGPRCMTAFIACGVRGLKAMSRLCCSDFGTRHFGQG